MTTVFIECLAFRFRVGQDKEFWVKTLFFLELPSLNRVNVSSKIPSLLGSRGYLK
jgi:hypothetical protein